MFKMNEYIADSCISISYQSCTLKMSCEVSMVLLHSVHVCSQAVPQKFTAQTKDGALLLPGQALLLVEIGWPSVAVSCGHSLCLAPFRQRFMSPDRHGYKEDLFLFHCSGED